eukprot:COSAG02_NODE_21588_length_782_cov_0.980966_1_plen_80_part_00
MFIGVAEAACLHAIGAIGGGCGWSPRSAWAGLVSRRMSTQSMDRKMRDGSRAESCEQMQQRQQRRQRAISRGREADAGR